MILSAFFQEGDKLKKIKLSKNKGEIIDHFIVTMLGLFSFFVIIFASINYIGSINTYVQSNRIARNYMLKMESHGCLSTDNALELRQQLSNLGLENINLDGTTFTQVNNGDDIHLDIKFTEKVRTLTMDKGFNIKFTDSKKDIEIPLSSTAKN